MSTPALLILSITLGLPGDSRIPVLLVISRKAWRLAGFPSGRWRFPSGVDFSWLDCSPILRARFNAQLSKIPSCTVPGSGNDHVPDAGEYGALQRSLGCQSACPDRFSAASALVPNRLFFRFRPYKSVKT